MITITALQTVVPGREAQLDQLMADLTARVRANELGCVSFEYVVPDGGDGSTRLVVERYRDDAALAAHRTTDYLRDFLPVLLECLVGPPDVTTYRDLVATPAHPPSFFHTGIVVPDLQEAVKVYSDVLGLAFTEPAEFHVPRLEDPDPHPFTLTGVFSMSDPPYYELIQAEGDGIVSAANAGSILYYGIWETDMAARWEWLRANNVGIDALFRPDESSPPFAIITAPDLLGGRVEYVDIADKGPIEEWVRTGRYPGGVGG